MGVFRPWTSSERQRAAENAQLHAACRPQPPAATTHLNLPSLSLRLRSRCLRTDTACGGRRRQDAADQ